MHLSKIKYNFSKINPRARPTFKSSKSLFKGCGQLLISISPSLFRSRSGDFSQRLFTKNLDLIFCTYFFDYHFLPKIKTKIKAFLDQGFQLFIIFADHTFLLSRNPFKINLSLFYQNQENKKHLHTHTHSFTL